MSATASARRVPFVDIEAMHRDLLDDFDRAWGEVMRSGRFIGGPHVERFEIAWAAVCSRRHAIGAANGTDAVELALRALGIGPGDEVVVPANTFIATAVAVSATGATPRFADVDERTLLVTPDTIAAVVTERTAAIIPVHLYGQVCDMKAICAYARARGLAVVEDAAQAHLAFRDGRPAGSFGDAGCFSFYPGKNLGAFGDGGAIVTDDDGIAARVRSIADLGRTSRSRYAHDEIGRNSRLDALQAALLCVKIPHLAAWNEARRRAARLYDAALAGSAVRPVARAPGSSAYHLYVVRTARRDQLVEHLARRGIATGIHYPIPCHQQAAYVNRKTPELPAAELAAREVLSLPMHPKLQAEDVALVAGAIACWASHGSRSRVEPSTERQ